MTHSLFTDSQVPLDLLRQRAYNFRWAETEPDVIPLTAADPDFQAAPEIRQAVADYAASGVYSYGPHQGLPQFKKAIAKGLGERKSYDILPQLVLPIDSAASGMYAIARAFLTPGDEMIIFDPVDFLFEQSALAAGAKVVRCPVDRKTGTFRLDLLPQLVSERTRLIGVCNPHNPLGKLMTADELSHIAEFASQHDLWIMNDEIWSDIVYPDEKFVSFHHLPPRLNNRVITVYGFSKAFALAGMRVGAIIAPNEDIYQKLVSASHVMTTAGGVSTLSQIAATTALTQCWYWVDAFVEHLTHQRDYAVERINAMPGLSCHSPQATYLLFPNIEKTGLCAGEFVDLCNAFNLAIVPGNERFFGPGAKGHVRLCFATSHEILCKGLDRLEMAISTL